MMNLQEQGVNKLSLGQEQQEQPYTLQKLDAKISTLDHQVTIQNIIFQINQSGISLLKQLPSQQQPQTQPQQWQTIFASFANTTSIGTDNSKLLIFIGDKQIQEDQQQPLFLRLQHPQPLNIILGNTNNYIVQLQFKRLGLNVMKEVHQLLTAKMNQADENNSRYDQDQEFQEMISADQIDQNGNILPLKKQNMMQQEQQGDEDMQDQQGQGNQTKNNRLL